MRRPVAAAAVLAAVALTAQHASAAAPKKFTHTLYFHGSNMVGNLDQEGTGAGLMAMDATKPTGSAKEFAVWGAGVTPTAVTPNTDCGGNALFPNWIGSTSGNLVGTAKVTFWARAVPNSSLEIRIFPDTLSQACNSTTGGNNYNDPIGDVTVPAPAGATPTQVTVTVPIIGKGKVAANITVQISPMNITGASFSGVSYDSAAMPSSITFTCTPKKGKKAC